MTNLKHLTLVSVLIAGSCLEAQEANGIITGTVRDPNGKPVAGATVTISSAQMLGSRPPARTDAQGNYRLPLLTPGQYTVTVSMQGFVGNRATVTVTGGSTIRADLNLKSVAIQEEVVEITGGENPIIDKTETKVASTYTSNQLQSLPTGGTTGMYAAAMLSPGVAGGESYAQMRGGIAGSAMYTVNGISTKDSAAGQGRQYELVLDDLIQDVQVIQNPINAKYGFSQTGLISLTTKTGTNSFQGSFRLKLSNPAWRTYNTGYVYNRWGELDVHASSASTTLRPDEPIYYIHANPANDEIGRSYEVTLSGPVIKDRLTFTYGSRIIPSTFSTGSRYNPLSSTPSSNALYIPGFAGGQMYTGPAPAGAAGFGDGTEYPYWAAYLWGSNPVAPFNTLGISARNKESTSTYKLFWQITPSHHLEYNYTTNPYVSGVNFTGWLADYDGYPMNIQQSSTRLNRSLSYRGIIGSSGVLTAQFGSVFSNVRFANGPGDNVVVQMWNQNASDVLGRYGRQAGPFAFGGEGNNEIRSNRTYSIDYNHIWENHNIDVGFQMLEEQNSWGAFGINNRRFYTPARRYDGTYMVFDVSDKNSPLWTGAGLVYDTNETHDGRLGYLLNGTVPYVPAFRDYNPDTAGGDIMVTGTTASFYLNDNWTLNDHWAINLGLRVDNSKLEDATGERLNSTAVTPRVRLQYDLFGDNQHVFALSAVQRGGTIGPGHVGRAGREGYTSEGYAVSGTAMDRRYFWNKPNPNPGQQSWEPYWVSHEEFLNPANYGYLYSYTNHAAAWVIDPGLKPQLTTEFELNYRRAFAQGGFFRVALIYNFLSNGLVSEIMDEAIEIKDPNNNSVYSYKRYLHNDSSRGRHYASAEMEWMMPLANRASWRLEWHGNWTLAKTTGNALFQAHFGSQASAEGPSKRYYEILEKIGMPREYVDPWGPLNTSLHSVRTWFALTHGVRGGIINEVSLLGRYDSGVPQIGNQTYTYSRADAWSNSTQAGGQVGNFPTSVTIHPFGRGYRKGTDSYYVNLQYNITVPVKNKLSVFCQITLNNIFNSIVENDTYANWGTGVARTWVTGQLVTDDPYWQMVMPASITDGRAWGINSSFLGARAFNTQFDVGFRF